MFDHWFPILQQVFDLIEFLVIRLALLGFLLLGIWSLIAPHLKKKLRAKRNHHLRVRSRTDVARGPAKAD
jgi:hypothetical protein